MADDSKDMYYEREDIDADVIHPDNKAKDDHKYDIDITSFRISCKSDKFDGSNMMGLVIFEYDRKTEWRINGGPMCKNAYIYVQKSSNVTKWAQDNYKGNVGTMHAKTFAKLYDNHADINKVIGGGFAYKDGKWVFRSGTFNAVDDHYHYRWPNMKEKVDKAKKDNAYNRQDLQYAYNERLRTMANEEQEWFIDVFKYWKEHHYQPGFTIKTVDLWP